jgi:hypothetical protein
MSAPGRQECLARPDEIPLKPFSCNLSLTALFTRFAAASYSDDGIFITIGGICAENSYLSALYAFSKKALYSTPPAHNRRAGAADSSAASSTPVVMRATYLPSASWYASLPAKDQLLEFDPFNPNTNAFNTYVLPSRPQSVEDVPEPFFVMGKVSALL